MRRHFSKREGMLVCFLLAVLAGYAVYAAVYRPLWLRLQDLQVRIDAGEKKLARQKDFIREWSARSALRRPFLKGRLQHGPDGSVHSGMLAALQEISAGQKVRITDMKPAPVRTEETCHEFSVSMILEGHFTDVMRFVFEAASRRYGFCIRRFRLASSRGAKTALRCEIVVSRLFFNGAASAPVMHFAAEDAPQAAEDDTDDEGRSFEAYESVFSGRDIFQPPAPVHAAGAEKKQDRASARFEQRYKIVAVLIDHDPRVVFENMSSRKTVFLSAGDSIDGLVVERIGPGEVVLRAGGDLITMNP